MERGIVRVRGARGDRRENETGSRADDARSDLDRIQGTWVRLSTDGRKADRTVKMVVTKATGRARGEVPEGAAAFVFEWKTEGADGVSHNRVLLDPNRNPKTLDFFPEGKNAPKVCPAIYKLDGDTL